MTTQALIFDMDGTMVNSMPAHAQSWVAFAQRHGVAMDLAEMMRRTTGRNGVECMRELLGADLPEPDALRLIAEKEAMYRALYAPQFSEVAGFKAFAAAARARGIKVGVGTAGDRHNIAFAMAHLQMQVGPQHTLQTVVGGDEGLAGKPEPAIFLEAAKRLNTMALGCIVFEDAPFGIEAARRAGMRAVAVCTTHSAAELAGDHVIAAIKNYHELLNSDFLEKLDVVIA